MLADPASASTLPPQTQMTIGDQLTTANVDWAWYATSWDAATTDGTQDPTKARTVIYTPSTARGTPDFQPHHQAFNYYSRFDPVAHADERAAHLKDYSAMLSDITTGTLPPVAWYKPTGNINQHPGYANVDDGDAHIADLVQQADGEPAVDAHGHRHHLRRVRRPVGSRRAAQGRSARPRLAHPGDHHLALREEGHRRPYAVRLGVDHPPHREALRPRCRCRASRARDTALKAVSGGKAMGDLTAALNVD